MNATLTQPLLSWAVENSLFLGTSAAFVVSLSLGVTLYLRSSSYKEPTLPQAVLIPIICIVVATLIMALSLTPLSAKNNEATKGINQSFIHPYGITQVKLLDGVNAARFITTCANEGQAQTSITTDYSTETTLGAIIPGTLECKLVTLHNPRLATASLTIAEDPIHPNSD